MHIQYVVLCEQVIVASDGRPSLVNILGELAAPSLPVTVPRLAFAARLLFPAEETGRSYRVEVAITDPAGAEIGRPGGDVSLPDAPAGAESIAVDLPLAFDMFQVAAPGRFTFMLHVDGEPKGAAQLAVRQAASA